jgi:hypothetical protein
LSDEEFAASSIASGCILIIYNASFRPAVATHQSFTKTLLSQVI